MFEILALQPKLSVSWRIRFGSGAQNWREIWIQFCFQMMDLLRGTQTTHGISIRRLDFSVDGFEVHLFHFFVVFKIPLQMLQKLNSAAFVNGFWKQQKKWNWWTSKPSTEKTRRRIEIPWVLSVPSPDEIYELKTKLNLYPLLVLRTRPKPDSPRDA